MNLREEWKNERNRIDAYAVAENVRRTMLGMNAVTDEDVRNLCEEAVEKDAGLSFLDAESKQRLTRNAFCCLRCELELLQDYSDNPYVTEIMVNGPNNIFIEEKGCINRAPVSFGSAERLERVIQRIAAKVGREINDLNPILDARLSDGSRVNAVHQSLAIGGPILTIRKFSGEKRLTVKQLIANGDITEEAAEFLKRAVRCGYNIFVSGGTSSGKTTFLNILSDYIPSSERIVVIEDSAELAIRGHENLVRLEAKASNSQGKGSTSIKDLIKASLRMRPDRIIVGEVRGDEIVDMLAAMSTGHDGSLSTGHANSPKGMLSRMETLHIAASGFPMQAVRSQIAGAIELFVHLQRFSGGHRKVIEISELAGMQNGEIVLNQLFVYKNGKGLCRTDNSLVHKEKMELYEELYGVST